MKPNALLKAATDCKQVDGLPWGRSPAAFVVSMQFRYVMGQLNNLTVYKPKKKK
jgi:hypothetical protein